MNYADEATRKALEALEKKIKDVYTEAYLDVQAEASAYFATFQARYAIEYQAYLDGKYTKAEFAQWYKNQVARGKGWDALRDSMADRMTNADLLAQSYINDLTPTIYTINANYSAYEIEAIAGNGVSFQLVNEQTVKQLIEGKVNHTDFKITGARKSLYNWNTKQIERALTSGIAQGHGIKEISKDFLIVMQRDQASAIRNARTAVTSAQNGGKMATMEKAQEMGIEIRKKWVCTHDERTRLSHALLDGQIRDINDTFSNGLMYPADSAGDPGEVYNCRCTMVKVTKYSQYHNSETFKQWADRVGYEMEGFE